MNAFKLSMFCALLLVGAFSTVVSAATDPLSKANRLPPSLEQKVQDFQSAIIEAGYEVSRGYWDLWSTDDCKYPLQTVGFCYGNNPTAPYVLAFLPPWKDEFVDKSLKHALAQERKGMNPNYRLGEREALVILAELPPPARYFGLGTNVFTRQTQLNTEDPVYEILDHPETQALKEIIFGGSPNPDRLMMIATIGDTINNVDIEEQSKENWGQQRFFVITPDEDMADAMIEALKEVGVDETHVFTEPVGLVNDPNSESEGLVRLGYGPEADDFFTYIRYSMPNDIALGEKWREQLPLTILRVRDFSSHTANKPFNIPTYEAKTANTDEPTNLGGDLENLVDAVKEYWGQTSDENSLEFRSLSLWVDLVGQHCLGHDGPPPTNGIDLPRGPMNCLGDNQDADYQISAGTYQLDDNQVIAVVGTLGTETGNATYSSLSVNWFPELVGVLNRDDTVLKESAKKFKGALSDEELYTNFYVYYFARDCSGLYPWCHEISRKLIPRGDTIKIVQRNYVNPGSRRGPDPSMVLNPISIEFDGGKGKRPTM
jgi:hypothetical protein